MEKKMDPHFNPKPLEAFFKEVEEQIGISFHYDETNLNFPIQLNPEVSEISKIQCNRVLEFIKSQVDLKDSEIGKTSPGKTLSSHVRFEISLKAAKALAEIYALGFFYDLEP